MCTTYYTPLYTNSLNIRKPILHIDHGVSPNLYPSIQLHESFPSTLQPVIWGYKPSALLDPKPKASASHSVTPEPADQVI